MSNTPRTDEMVKTADRCNDDDVVHAEFARTMETLLRKAEQELWMFGCTCDSVTHKEIKAFLFPPKLSP